MTKLIGPAGRLVETIVPTLRTQKRVKMLLSGPPGVGKTATANAIGAALCGGAFAVESINGRKLTIHVVSDWQADFASSSLFGSGWKVKIVNEVDTCPKDAQDLLLSFLDEMPPNRGFIGTSNLELSSLTERFRTRLLCHEVKAPKAEEIAALLAESVPSEVAHHIANLCGGNVRAAVLDAEGWHQKNNGELAVLSRQLDMMKLHA